MKAPTVFHMEHLTEKDVHKSVRTSRRNGIIPSTSRIRRDLCRRRRRGYRKHGNRRSRRPIRRSRLYLKALGVKIDLGRRKTRDKRKAWNLFPVRAEIPHVRRNTWHTVTEMLGLHRTISAYPRILDQPSGSHDAGDSVYRGNTYPPMAKFSSNLGVKRGMVVYSQDSPR